MKNHKPLTDKQKKSRLKRDTHFHITGFQNEGKKVTSAKPAHTADLGIMLKYFKQNISQAKIESFSSNARENRRQTNHVVMPLEITKQFQSSIFSQFYTDVSLIPDNRTQNQKTDIDNVRIVRGVDNSFSLDALHDTDYDDAINVSYDAEEIELIDENIIHSSSEQFEQEEMVQSAVESRLPVMVYVHGGSYFCNAGRLYPGEKLASTGLVVVTLNYRLGAFGQSHQRTNK